MAKHYHVLCGMGGGYMPDSNYFCSTKRDAESTAKWCADEWRDSLVDMDPENVTRVQGNKREGYIISRPNDPHDLGHYIDIVECDETECDEEDC